jgi:hypothetical protein
LGVPWSVKTLLGLLAAVVISAGLLPGWFLLGHAVEWVRRDRDFLPGYWFSYSWDLSCLWTVYGFAAGLLCGMLFSKRIIALVVALAAGAAPTLLWVPSWAAGGLPLWQVLVGPAVVLLVTRLILAAWSTERAGSLRSVLTILAGVVLALGWQALCLAWRVLEVPDVGEPFDVATYRAELSALEKNDAPQVIRRALRDLKTQLDGNEQLRKKLSDVGYKDTEVYDVLHGGWKYASPELGKDLDRLFNQRWVAELQRGVWLPPGLFYDPRRPPVLFWDQGLATELDVTTLCILRAHQLQAKGQDEAALQLLRDILALSRHLCQEAPSRQFVVVQRYCEGMALEGMQLWAARTRDAGLRRRAAAELTLHEEKAPPADSAIKADYLGAPSLYQKMCENLSHQNRERAVDPQGTLGVLLEAGQQLPWEHERTERLFNYIYAVALDRSPPDPYLQAHIPRWPISFVSQFIFFELVKKWEKQNLSLLRDLRSQLEGPGK